MMCKIVMKEDGLLQKLKSFLTWMKRLIYFTIHSFPGACVSIERAIGEPLMWFPCVHHIMELVVGAMVHTRWPTSGPIDAIYIRFKSSWPEIHSKMPNIIERGEEKVKFYLSVAINN